MTHGLTRFSPWTSSYKVEITQQKNIKEANTQPKAARKPQEGKSQSERAVPQ